MSTDRIPRRTEWTLGKTVQQDSGCTERPNGEGDAVRTQNHPLLQSDRIRVGASEEDRDESTDKVEDGDLEAQGNPPEKGENEDRS